ncbi:transposase [Nocardia sp. NPDC051463]|uniref:integrase core domain-containing protein n=1 Tax=Nocardia sp. NPDC051463 TaxID=3154845 RepID=UPI00344FA9C9
MAVTEGGAVRTDRGQVRRGMAGVGASQDRGVDACRRLRGFHLDGAASCLQLAVTEAERVLGLEDLRADRGLAEVIGPGGELLGMAPAPIAVVSDNGPCFRGGGVQVCVRRAGPAAAARSHLGRSPQTNGVIERFFGILKYEHLFRGVIAEGDALDMEVHRFRIIYNTVRPHQALGDRVPSAAFTCCDQRKNSISGMCGCLRCWFPGRSERLLED